MTIRTNPPITLADVLAELRVVNANRGMPISLGDTDVRNLAGKPSGAVYLSDLYGKSSYIPMTAYLPNANVTAPSNASSPYNQQVPLQMQLSGGQAPYSISWVHISGDGTVDNLNSLNSSARMPVQRFGEAGDTKTQVVQCAVVDATGAQIVRQCTVTLTLV